MKALAEQINELDGIEIYGRVVGVRGLMVEVSGPLHAMSVGARVVIETVARLLPLVLGNEDSALHESFSEGLLEHPQYTRPAEFRGWEVPEVLRSGDHGAVAAWRRTAALLRT